MNDVTLHWLALCGKANRFLKGSQVESTLNQHEHQARTGAGFILVGNRRAPVRQHAASLHVRSRVAATESVCVIDGAACVQSDPTEPQSGYLGVH